MPKILRSIFAVVLAVFSFQALAASEQPATLEGAKTISAEELLDLVDKFEDLVIIDARPVADYDKGHLPEVVRLSNTDTNAETLAEVIPSKTTPVAFYCNGVKCARSGESVGIAREAGYQNIYWFRGGIGEWKDKGYPIEM